jgi:hypothetical protein
LLPERNPLLAGQHRSAADEDPASGVVETGNATTRLESEPPEGSQVAVFASAEAWHAGCSGPQAATVTQAEAARRETRSGKEVQGR